ncbi:restriction endonuclease subunit S [Janthinobacterium sp. B9-8]|uniref:restriction endonuclease subunit S n=1 Tax=Janthinobacterium sp. B9-8 TaxID=1236179 RepID=UPI000699F436|nr:restriction endonuclease subunit S [Janthinobacterium sp. B9-8]AMC35578.1 restriction endonuclease subunit S [Janthinobacterium sp. B9-8]
MSFDLPYLPEGWNYKSLEDCARKQSISYGVVQPGTALADGIPIIRVNNFNNGRIELADLMKISPEIETKYSRTRLVGGEVLITLVGSVGQVAVAPVTVAGFNVARAVAVIHPIDGISPDWIAICLRSPLSQHLLVSRANTTVQTTINLKDLRALPLPIPPKEERDQIESLITTLDDRIALLRETNATLEAMAQALFKSWFVDFDPVHANASTKQMINPASSPSDFVGDPAVPLDSRLRGNDDLLPPELQTLFPATFTASSQGLVPEGWEMGSILELANLIGGGTPKTDRAEYWDGDISWASAKDVSQAKNLFLIETERTITAQGLKESATKLIPAFSSVIVARGATTGRMVLFGANIAMNQTCYALASKHAAPFFLNLFMQREIQSLTQRAHGSVFDTITTNTFSTSKTLLIPAQLQVAFEGIVSPVFEGILENTKQAQTLATLRDTLLPRLISGQLRLPEAEAALAEVG